MMRNIPFTFVVLNLLNLMMKPALSSITFSDITKLSGIDFIQTSGDPVDKKSIIEAKGGGVALFDYNGDGWLDIYFVNGNHLKNEPQPTNKLFHNNQDGTFSDMTKKAGVGDTGWGMGCAAADYDNDGDMDLYVTNYGPNFFYSNNGDGTFTNIIDNAICQSNLLSTGVAFADYDLDGWLDLVVADYLDLNSIQRKPGEPEKSAEWRGFAVFPGPRAYQAQGISLFHNNKDGTFEDVTTFSKLMDVPPAYSFTCLWVDVNHDRYPELYVANDSMPSYFYMNNGDGTFSENGLLAGVAYSEDGTEMASMGADFGDGNNDGEWDLTVTNFSEEPYSVLFGIGNGMFEDASYTSQVGHATYSSLGWGAHWMDFDNDGDEDLLYCNGHVYPEADHPDVDTSYAQPAQMFVNNGNRLFDETKSLGGDFHLPRVGRGSAIGDIDNDGDLDIVMNTLNGNAVVLRNDGGNNNNWLQIQLQGAESNRNGIGCTVKIKDSEWTAMKAVWSGSGFLSQSSMVIQIGLGNRESIEEIEVEWTNGNLSTLKKIKANQRITIKEDEEDE